MERCSGGDSAQESGGKRRQLATTALCRSLFKYYSRLIYPLVNHRSRPFCHFTSDCFTFFFSASTHGSRAACNWTSCAFSRFEASNGDSSDEIECLARYLHRAESVGVMIHGTVVNQQPRSVRSRAVGCDFTREIGPPRVQSRAECRPRCISLAQEIFYFLKSVSI